MIVQYEPYEQTSTQVLVGSQLASILSAYASKPQGPAVDVGVDLLRYNVKTFFVKNVGPTNRMNARLEATSVDATQRQASDWEIIDATTFQDLAAGSAKSKTFTGDSRRYWRVAATSVACSAIVNVCAR